MWALSCSFCASSLLSTSCGPQAGSQGVKIIGESEKGRRINLKVGDVFEVRLTTQPGTGYKWYLRPDAGSQLTLLDERQTRPAQEGYDRPVFQIFRFRVDHPGKILLHLDYLRPWEKSNPPAESYDVNLLVK